MISLILSEVKRMMFYDKKGTIRSLSLGLMTSLLAFGYTATMNILTDNLIGGKYTHVLYTFAIFVGIVIGRDILNGIYNYELSKHRIFVEGTLRCHFMEKAQCLQPIALEEPNTLDKLNKAHNGIDDAISTMISVEIILANALIYFVLIGAYFCKIHILLGVVLLSLVVPSVISYFAKARIGVHAEDVSAPLRRQMDYAENAVCQLEFFKETKQLEAHDFFENRFRQAAQKFKAARQEELSKKCRVDFLVDTAYFLGFTAIIFAILYLSAQKCIFVGDIAAVMVTVRVLMSYLNEIFNEKLAGIVEAYPGLKNLHEVLEITSEKVGACTPEYQKIELKNVKFRYPECQTFALDGIDLTIYDGEIICIVGENGSGKTTLSKILSGIYAPSSGTIRIDDHVFSGNESTGLRNTSTFVFQDFQKYAITLEENIFFGKAGTIPKIAEEVARTLPKKEKNDSFQTIWRH